MVRFLLLSYVVVLPITWVSLRWLHVPEHHHLVAGIFLTVVYGLFASTLAAVVLG